MAKKILSSFNKIDLFVVGTIVLLITFTFLAIVIPKKSNSDKALNVTVRISSNVDAIYQETIKHNTVYLNSVNIPVEIKDSKKINTKGADYLDITVSGPGAIEDNRYIFNNQRILVGQKAELHGSFWAQGIITEVKYAN